MNEVIATLNGYSVHKLQNDKAGTYYLCIPTQQVGQYEIFLGFPDKELDSLSKEELLGEIKKLSDLVREINHSGVCVLPNIPILELEQASLENDDRKYNELVITRIQPIMMQINEFLKQPNKEISQIINMVERNDSDKKIMGWLSIKLGDSYIREINFEKIMHKKSEEQEEINNNEQTYAFSSGIAPVNRMYDAVPDLGKKNRLVRRLTTQPPRGSSGFGNVKFIIVTLLSSLIVGVGIAYWLIK